MEGHKNVSRIYLTYLAGHAAVLACDRGACVADSIASFIPLAPRPRSRQQQMRASNADMRTGEWLLYRKRGGFEARRFGGTKGSVKVWL